MIYMDYAATTPVDKRVLEAMLPYFSDSFGNPSSVHRYGQKAEAAVDTARETVAKVLNCQPDEVIFTSCGSESDNLALRGVALAMRQKKNAKWLITSKAEHPAVSKTAQQLEDVFGFKVEWLELDQLGMVSPDAVEHAICGETALVSVMYANNEIGTINPVKEIADVCRKRESFFTRMPSRLRPIFRSMCNLWAWICFPSVPTNFTDQRGLAFFTFVKGPT